MAGDFKNTLCLPQTGFPMKANLPVREKEILERWHRERSYQALRELVKGRPSYVLHDGPPFANGDIHLGHVLNKVLKDVVVRYKTMRGFDALYIPGWDCHGLPIEHRVAKSLSGSEKTPVEIRRRSAEYAAKYIDIQKEQFMRLGIWGEWGAPYITMEPGYEAGILRVFATLVRQKLVFEGLKPVFWSTGCRTALAEAEIEYEDRRDAAVFVKFDVEQFSDKARPILDQHLQSRKAALVIWTTTPWTLPANLAVAANPALTYALVHDGEEWLVVCSGRIEELRKTNGARYEVATEISGAALEGTVYRHPFLERQGRVLGADFVTDDSGSGLVHIAPGHGKDDYVLGQKHGLEPFSPVDDAGRLTVECGVPELAGKYVFDANPEIVKLLRARRALLSETPFTHSYPHCWRSKTPIIFRSVKQWFIRVDSIRPKVLELIDSVRWVPDWGKNRIQGSVSSREDWCISRQRSWGIPIPVFTDAGGRAVLDPEAVERLAEIVEREGSDVWFKTPDAEMARRIGLDPALKKGTDTIDVWIDSGSSFASVVEKRLSFPADLYLEGSDQHRGWFQSSLLLSAMTRGQAPFKSVLTHGFVVDGEGRKMSKSVGNVVAPADVLGRLGADILRLWVVSSDYADDVRVSPDIFDRISDSYRKLRNTLRYLLGNLAGFRPDEDMMVLEEMLEPDRWALSRLSALTEETTAFYEGYQFHRVYQALYNFCVKDMSSVYFDAMKDRLYADAPDSISGRSGRTALFVIFKTLTRLMAPLLAFTAEEAWSHAPEFGGKHASIHAETWPEDQARFRDMALEEKWTDLLGVREKILKALEAAREKKEIGNSLEAEVELALFSESQYEFLVASVRILKFLCLVSELRVVHVSSKEEGEFQVRVFSACGQKCPRCWNYRSDIGRDPQQKELCGRCAEAVKGRL
ncbi:MAG: isoleucine--tRNA ligase [Candidatus Omnitrophica bacterium]|nr:isoleucine--tRNA ligase [Candidatus Omnitrophota bacterium]